MGFVGQNHIWPSQKWQGVLYYVSTLGVSLVKMTLGLVEKDKYCLY